MKWTDYLPGVGTSVLTTAGILFAIAIVGVVIAMARRYHLCPSDKLLVVYGRTGNEGGNTRAAKVIHGGGTIVLPLVQSHQFLSLKPISIEVVELKDALTRQNIRINVPSTFLVRISSRPGIRELAAQNLLGLSEQQIHSMAKDIIVGQFRNVIATLTIEVINSDRNQFVTTASAQIGTELNKVGLELVNVNIRDITDGSGYLQALGQRAAAEAVNRAKMEVAEQERTGSIGVADAMAAQRMKVAEANAAAVTGENTSKIAIAKSDADREVASAEAHRLAEAARRVKSAQAEKEAYEAEALTASAKADLERAEKTAEEVVAAEIAKTVVETRADAEAEKLRREAQGHADATLAKMTAEANGLRAMLAAQAEGFQAIVAAAGGKPEVALGYLIQQRLPELMHTYTDAVKGIHVDKVVLMGGASGDGAGVAAHVRDVYKAVPGIREMLEAVGMDMPSWLASGAKSDAEVQTVLAAPKSE